MGCCPHSSAPRAHLHRQVQTRHGSIQKAVKRVREHVRKNKRADTNKQVQIKCILPFLKHLQRNRGISPPDAFVLHPSAQYLSSTPLFQLLASIYPSLTDLHRFSTLQRPDIPPTLPHQPRLPHWPSAPAPTPKTPLLRPGLCLRPLRVT